jgi:membrane protein
MSSSKSAVVGRCGKSGIVSAVVALAFAVYNGYLGIVHEYIFGLSISVYFAVLSVIYFILVDWNVQKGVPQTDGETRVRKYITSSVLLLVVDVLLVGPITLMVLQRRQFNLGMIAAITVATYATYKVCSAVVNYVKTRKNFDVRSVSVRSVKLVDAMVSLLTLQNTLIVANGSSKEQDMFVLTSWTSFALYAAIVGVSIVGFRRCLSASKMAKAQQTEQN